MLDEMTEESSLRLLVRRERLLRVALRRELEGSGRGGRSIILISYFVLGI